VFLPVLNIAVAVAAAARVTNGRRWIWRFAGDITGPPRVRNGLKPINQDDEMFFLRFSRVWFPSFRSVSWKALVIRSRGITTHAAAEVGVSLVTFTNRLRTYARNDNDRPAYVYSLIGTNGKPNKPLLRKPSFTFARVQKWKVTRPSSGGKDRRSTAIFVLVEKRESTAGRTLKRLCNVVG